MAPSGGEILIPKAIRLAKNALRQAKAVLRPPTSGAARPILNQAVTSQTKTAVKHSHSTSSNRWFSSAAGSSSKPTPTRRANFPVSRTSNAITQSGASPFASILRPNLTGGTLPRSAGGYGLGGSGRARHFSHTSGCQAQVLQNVNAGIRAFFVNGQKARYEGTDPVTGNKRWSAVGQTETRAYKRWQETRNAVSVQRQKLGTSLDFDLTPTLTALRDINFSAALTAEDLEGEDMSLPSNAFFPRLSCDNARISRERALKERALMKRDIELLSRFGDLDITVQNHISSDDPLHTGPFTRVRFPGCDAANVRAICDELCISRGTIHQDPGWDAVPDYEMPAVGTWTERANSSEPFGGMSLHMPHAPLAFHSGGNMSYLANEDGEEESLFPGSTITDAHGSATPFHHNILTPSSSALSVSDLSSLGTISSSQIPNTTIDEENDNIVSSPSDEMEFIANTDDGVLSYNSSSDLAQMNDGSTTTAADYEGMEGIYRFLREIEDAGNRRHFL